MPIRSFQAKLVLLFVAVLILLQGVTVVAVRVAGQRTMRATIVEELEVGSRVFDQLVAARARQLSDNVRLLASDFAFREAIALGDRATIASVLSNHGSRIEADAALLISLEGLVVADTFRDRLAGTFPFQSLLREAETGGESSAIVAIDGRPYQLVIVPVLAPRPIAWVAMGFVIDERLLTELRRLTSLEVSLWRAAGEREPLLASTLPQQDRNALQTVVAKYPVSDGDSVQDLELGTHAYMALRHPLPTADGSRFTTLLQRSVAEAERPYRKLELQIFALSGLALLIALLAAVYFARSVSRPLEVLASEAQRIEHGEYTHDIEVSQQDEIGRLAAAFNQMRRGIADREEKIRVQATHDALTNLPNRTLFLDRLEQSILHARRDKSMVGILIMDVDRFKEINDTLGHHFGDELLIEIGRRLAHTLRGSDTVARLGGDEFAVTFPLDTIERATDVAHRIAGALESAFVLAGVTIDVAASMGIALYPTHAEDAETLMQRADVAMYDAKRQHLRFAIYETGRDEHSLRRLAMLSELRQSIARDELELHYQPIVEAGSGRAIHAEALVRWRHPVHGLLRPDEFVPLAEQSGNIGLITKWVLRRAVSDCGQWNASGLDLTVAVNLSALDLFDSELPTHVSGLLAEAKLEPGRLVLEITESAVMQDPAQALRILRDLKTRGIRLAIDDYGTGYSSLAHLKRLPVDELKIDKSFVLPLLETASDDLVIVRSTIDLGHNMGLHVIAEGVETPESWRILRRLGCDMAQGYLISKPIPADRFVEWMRAGGWTAPE